MFVSDSGEQRLVVTDEDKAESLLIDGFTQELDRLTLHDRVEPRCWFISDDCNRIEKEDAGEGEPLGLAARDLARATTYQLHGRTN
jgi:hypothetical protein